jgi:hypothetical protein
MTLVASFGIDDYPLLLGDLLLSGPERIGKPASFPTVGEITNVFPEGSGFVPSGMSQKIAIISNRFAIGWSGSRSAARTLIRELYERNQIEPFTYDSMMQFFRSVDRSVWRQGLNIIGFIKDFENSNLTQHFSLFACSELSTKLFGNVKVLGSGAQRFSDLPESGSLPIPPTRELNKLELAVSIGVSLAGASLGAEIASPQSLLQYYGGGYEIASLFDGKFRKLDDVTYLFWYGEITTAGLTVSLHHFCKYSYVNDVLLIRVMRSPKFVDENHQKVDEIVQCSDPAIYVVSPIYRQVEREELGTFQVPSFNSKLLCNYFFTRYSSKKGVGVHSVVYILGDDRSPIEFIENGTKLSLNVNKEWLNEHLQKLINHSKSMTSVCIDSTQIL